MKYQFPTFHPDDISIGAGVARVDRFVSEMYIDLRFPFCKYEDVGYERMEAGALCGVKF